MAQMNLSTGKKKKKTLMDQGNRLVVVKEEALLAGFISACRVMGSEDNG